jgi:hypothetical protein
VTADAWEFGNEEFEQEHTMFRFHPVKGVVDDKSIAFEMLAD